MKLKTWQAVRMTATLYLIINHSSLLPLPAVKAKALYPIYEHRTESPNPRAINPMNNLCTCSSNQVMPMSYASNELPSQGYANSPQKKVEQRFPEIPNNWSYEDLFISSNNKRPEVPMKESQRDFYLDMPRGNRAEMYPVEHTPSPLLMDNFVKDKHEEQVMTKPYKPQLSASLHKQEDLVLASPISEYKESQTEHKNNEDTDEKRQPDIIKTGLNGNKAPLFPGDDNDPNVIRQVIFIEPPEYFYKHELNLIEQKQAAAAAKPKPIRIYVLPPQVTHSYNITDQRVKPTRPIEPTIYYLTMDHLAEKGNNDENEINYGQNGNNGIVGGSGGGAGAVISVIEKGKAHFSEMVPKDVQDVLQSVDTNNYPYQAPIHENVKNDIDIRSGSGRAVNFQREYDHVPKITISSSSFEKDSSTKILERGKDDYYTEPLRGMESKVFSVQSQVPLQDSSPDFGTKIIKGVKTYANVEEQQGKFQGNWEKGFVPMRMPSNFDHYNYNNHNDHRNQFGSRMGSLPADDVDKSFEIIPALLKNSYYILPDGTYHDYS